MSLRRKLVETLAKLLRVPLSPGETSLTIVVEN